jgi:hypothetical protein
MSSWKIIFKPEWRETYLFTNTDPLAVIRLRHWYDSGLKKHMEAVWLKRMIIHG